MFSLEERWKNASLEVLHFVRFEFCDVRQVPVFVVIVESVADDKRIGNAKPEIIRFEFHPAATLFPK